MREKLDAWWTPSPKAAAAPAPARKPNIVFFIIDELGYYELSCLGHPDHRTPNVDRLAAEGIRFTQCLAGAPVCAPTRCVLMTGKHLGHTSVRDNPGWTPLREGEATIASMLKGAGYATGGFGKWGCGARGTSGVPEEHGFDVFFGYYDQVHAHTYYPRYLIRNSREVPLEGNTGDPYDGKTFSHYRIVEEAKRFIRENKDRPFFAYLPWTPPHGLWGFPKDDPSWALYRDKPWTQGQRTRDDAKVYAAMVNMVDRQAGEILGLLKKLGLDDDTIVFFCGDNGTARYFGDADHPDGLFRPNVDPRTGRRFRGFKGSLYEGGLRIPFIVRWPGRIKKGRVTDHLASFADVMPTIADLAGADCPADTDGISFVPEILGEEAAGRTQRRHAYLYWEYGQAVAVRMDEWKAIRPKTKAAWELYDLSTDISETRDLAAARPEILRKMEGFAAEAHVPVRPGTVHDRSLLEKDKDYR
ncbi:MAG: arylsulfatase [Planctomycetes bacterium]|nr:arylsulfatase [Planctomycetota bacterium]